MAIDEMRQLAARRAVYEEFRSPFKVVAGHIEDLYGRHVIVRAKDALAVNLRAYKKKPNVYIQRAFESIMMRAIQQPFGTTLEETLKRLEQVWEERP